MNTVIFILLFVVFAIMVSGLAVLAIGGNTSKKYSNKLMMARIAFQGLVVVLLGLMFMLK